MENLGETLRHIPRNEPVAALKLGNVGLRYAQALGKLFLGDVFPHVIPAHDPSGVGVGEYIFEGMSVMHGVHSDGY